MLHSTKHSTDQKPATECYGHPLKLFSVLDRLHVNNCVLKHVPTGAQALNLEAD